MRVAPALKAFDDGLPRESLEANEIFTVHVHFLDSSGVL